MCVCVRAHVCVFLFLSLSLLPFFSPHHEGVGFVFQKKRDGKSTYRGRFRMESGCGGDACSILAFFSASSCLMKGKETKKKKKIRAKKEKDFPKMYRQFLCEIGQKGLNRYYAFKVYGTYGTLNRQPDHKNITCTNLQCVY